MSEFVEKPIKKKLNRQNPISRIERLERQTGAKPSDTVRSLDELSISSGTLNEGAFVDPSDDSGSEEPTDSSFSGVFLTGDSFTPADEAGDFNFARVESGVTKYAFNGSGTYSNGLDFFNVQKATGTSTAERRLRSGFQELQGNDDPSYLFEYLDTNVGANLITLNPGYETGDSTGWTLSSGSAVVADVYFGSNYMLRLDEADQATSDKYACSAGSTLNVSYPAYSSKAGGNVISYIRFYNAVPTLLSTVTLVTHSGIVLNASYSAQVVVPVGATQFDIYIDNNNAGGTPGAIYLDNFSVTVVTISNEFGFHGEDGQLLMGNGKFKTNDLGAYISRGNLSGVVFATNTNTTISTSGQTTVFSGTIPANFFTKGQIRFKVMAYVNTNASGRTITPRLIVGGTTLTGFVYTLGGNLVWVVSFEGTISYNATDVQELNLSTERVQSATGGTSYAKDISRGTAANDDASTIDLSFTLQLSGGVDTGIFSSVIVEDIMNVDVW